jgi:hypothetical protein
LLKLAISLEASNLDCAALSKEQTTPNAADEKVKSTRSTVSDIDKISTRRNFRREPFERPRNRPTHRNRLNSRPRREASQQRRGKIDYRALGIEGLCMRCGCNNHTANKCWANNLRCRSCRKEGHVEKVCITTLLQNQPRSSTTSLSYNAAVNTAQATRPITFEPHYNTYKLQTIFNLYNTQIESEEECDIDDKYYITVRINNCPVRMEVDTGAKFSLLPIDKFQSLKFQTPILPANVGFRSYSGEITPAEGKVHVNVEYRGRKIRRTLYLVPANHATLLGRTWIRGLQLNLNELDQERTNSTTVNSIQVAKDSELLTEYADLFQEKVGCIPNIEVEYELRTNAAPCFTRKRSVPHTLWQKVKSELKELEEQGIITRCETSDWGSLIVTIQKPDGNVCLCVDYKTGVNNRLVSASYPIRKIPQIMDNLRGSRYFCKLDLFKAYLHVKVTEKSAIVQAITTHKGIFKMNRLSFGIKTAPAISNQIMSQILQDIPKTESLLRQYYCAWNHKRRMRPKFETLL